MLPHNDIILIAYLEANKDVSWTRTDPDLLLQQVYSFNEHAD